LISPFTSAELECFFRASAAFPFVDAAAKASGATFVDVIRRFGVLTGANPWECRLLEMILAKKSEALTAPDLLANPPSLTLALEAA
jgi:hypothetical protein